jgi:hypothetical protein
MKRPGCVGQRIRQPMEVAAFDVIGVANARSDAAVMTGMCLAARQAVVLVLEVLDRRECPQR